MRQRLRWQQTHRHVWLRRLVRACFVVAQEVLDDGRLQPALFREELRQTSSRRRDIGLRVELGDEGNDVEHVQHP